MARSRSTRIRDRVILVTGLLVIAGAAAGAYVVESRAGPFLHPVEPATLPLDVQGEYLATSASGTMGPGGICIPDAPGGSCAASRLHVVLRIEGLPRLEGTAHHVAALHQAGGPPLVLGALTFADGAYTLEHDEARDAGSFERLTVSAESSEHPTRPVGPVVYTQAVEGERPIDLGGTFVSTPSTADGSLALHQIGAFSVSLTLYLEVEGLVVWDGWIHRVWLHEADGGATFVGELAPDGDGHAWLDERIERVWVDRVDRVSVTLEPAGRGTGAGPQGLPLLIAET